MKRVRKFVPLVVLVALQVLMGAVAAGDHEYDFHAGNDYWLIDKDSVNPSIPTDDRRWDSGTEDVIVTNNRPEHTDNDTLWEVGDVGTGLAGDLIITVADPDDPASYGYGNAELLIGSRAKGQYTYTDSNGTVHNTRWIRFAGDASLTGWSDEHLTDPKGGRAVLRVEDGAVVWIAGDTMVNKYATFTVSDGTVYTNSLLVDGKGAEVRITGTNGYLRSAEMVEIAQGRVMVDTGGLADFRKGAVVSGEKAVLEMAGQGGIALGDPTLKEPDPDGWGIWLLDGGRMVVNGADNVVTDTRHGNGFIYNQSGYFLVEGGGVLDTDHVLLESDYSTKDIAYGTEIAGTLNAKTVIAGGASTTLVTANTGKLTTSGNFTLQNSARLFVEGRLEVRTGTLRVNGGTLRVEVGGVVNGLDMQFNAGDHVIAGTIGTVRSDATLDPDGRLVVSGGTMRILGTGVSAVTDLRTSGGELTLEAGASVMSGTQLSSAGGKVHIHSSSLGDLAVLRTAGSGEMNVHASLSTQTLAVGGGNLNLHAGTVRATTSAAVGGAINLRGGNLFLDGSLSIAGGVIAGFSDNSRISMNDHSVTVAAGGTIDAGAGNIFIEGVTDFTLNGTYIAGSVNGSTTMLSLTGMGDNNGLLTISDPDNQAIQLTRDLQVRANSQEVSHGNGILVLSTDSQDYSGNTSLRWEDDVYGTYLYSVIQDPITGIWNVYITGSVARSREEQRESIRSEWEEHPEVGTSGVDKVLNPSMLDAIIDGTAIRIGREGDYDSLNNDGKFNAGVLSTLFSPDTSGYDALMLYNGSGLGMVNNAIVNNNQATLKRLTSRNSFIRREMDQACVLMNPGCDFEYEIPDRTPANRFWATGNYTSDSSGHKDGFAGYKYRGKGVVLGFDRVLDRVAVGVAGSYMGGSFKDQSALSNNSSIDTYGIYGYGNYAADNGIFVSGALGYAYSDTKLRDYRILDGAAGWNHGDFGADSFLIAVGVGKDLEIGSDFSLTPSIGFTYIDAHLGSHSQYFSPDGGGRGANTLEADAIKGHSAQIPLDIAFSHDWVVDDESGFTMTANIGYAYELHNKGAHGYIRYGGLTGVSPVKIASREMGRHIVNLGLNGKYFYRNFEIGFGYDFTGKKKYNSHNFLLSGGVVF